MKPRRLREADPRIETGVVQFGQDWPGVFIRGDNAYGMRVSLERVIDFVQDPVNEGKKLAVCISDMYRLISLLDLLKASQADPLQVKLRQEVEKKKI